MSDPVTLYPQAPPTQVDVLIFSKDRAAQLDLLLRSILAHAPAVYGTITVLYTWSAKPYLDGYLLALERFPGLRWQPEGHFEGDVRRWLDETAGPAVGFLVDDDVFYRPAPQPPRLPWSYRGGDYDYPFSLDGNVYHREHLLTLLHGLRFRDPTELEARGHERRERLPFTEVLHGDPCLVGIPANRVSASSGMPHLGVHEYDLNERYLGGERLSLEAVSRLGVLPAHAPLGLVFA